MKNIIFLSIFCFLLTGCVTPGETKGDTGELVQPLTNPGFIKSTDTILFAKKDGKSNRSNWVEAKLDGTELKPSPFFPGNSMVHIRGVSPDGRFVILKQWDRVSDPKSPLQLHRTRSARNSGLYVLDRVNHKLREVARPPSGYPFDHAILSPDGKQILASASRASDKYCWTQHTPNDDRLYIIDVASLQSMVLKPHFGNAGVSELHWSPDGKEVFNVASRCAACGQPYHCTFVFLQRDLGTDSITVRVKDEEDSRDFFPQVKDFEGRLWESENFPYRRATKCDGYSLEERLFPSDDLSKGYSAELRLVDKKGAIRTIARFDKRTLRFEKRSGGINPISLGSDAQFTSDCNYILFSIEDDIFVAEVKGTKLAKVGTGDRVTLLPAR